MDRTLGLGTVCRHDRLAIFGHFGHTLLYLVRNGGHDRDYRSTRAATRRHLQAGGSDCRADISLEVGSVLASGNFGVPSVYDRRWRLLSGQSLRGQDGDHCYGRNFHGLASTDSFKIGKGSAGSVSFEASRLASLVFRIGSILAGVEIAAISGLG